jgi:hypothetical protein
VIHTVQLLQGPNIYKYNICTYTQSRDDGLFMPQISFFNGLFA